MLTPLQKFATEIRIGAMRSFAARGFGHVGGSFSVADAIAALYGSIMKFDPKNPSWEGRDRLVCSKGHAGPAIYAALALKGYFPYEWLETLNQPGTKLPSHCDKNLTPGIDMTTGSLGQGASTAAGMAWALRANGSDARIFLILGDGECNEGQVWEMAMLASAKKLNNLIAFVDHNGKQLDGTTQEILDMRDIEGKFKAFDWYTQSINGNDPDAIVAAVQKAKAEQGDKPACIVLNTIKGAGVKEIEDTEFNHHINVSAEQAERYTAELKAKLAQ